MAKTHISFSVFSLLFLFSSLQIHGRDSKFFSKVTHLTSAQSNVALVPSSSPSPSPAPIESESQNGYGLFGRGSGQFETTNTNTDDENENGTPSEGLASESYPNYNTGYTNTNDERLAGETMMSINNAYTNDQNQEMSDTRFMYHGKYYGPSDNNNNEGLGGETLMSDNNNDNGYATTYNSDNNDDNYLGGYETEQKATTAGSNEGNYHGNNVKYEFDSMEEYDKYQKQNNGGYWP